MDKQTVRLNDQMYLTIEECPIDYFSSDTKRAERVITYWNDQKVSTWDVYLNDDTRFFMNFEAEPEFRNGRWLELLATYEPGSMSRFDRPNTVWFKAGEWVVNDKERIVSAVKDLRDRNVMQSGTVFSTGSLNEVISLD